MAPEVNQIKTKISIFSNKKMQQNLIFTYNQHELEIDDYFVNIVTQFTYNGRFQKRNQRLVDRGCKSMFAVLKIQGNYIYL